MICTEKERKSCNEEKLGCEGCYYSKISEEEKEFVRAFRRMKEMGVKKMILQDAEIINNQQQWRILQLEEEIDELRVQRDYYKREYSLYEKTFEEVVKILNKNNGG